MGHEFRVFGLHGVLVLPAGEEEKRQGAEVAQGDEGGEGLAVEGDIILRPQLLLQNPQKRSRQQSAHQQRRILYRRSKTLNLHARSILQHRQ